MTGTFTGWLVMLRLDGSVKDDKELWFNFFSPSLWCFSPSGWCFLEVQAQGMYLSLGPRLLQQCRLAYGTALALFGLVELLVVSCVSVHSRCTTSHMAGAYTLSFFEIRGRTVQPVWVALDSPTKTFKGCILQPDVLCYISENLNQVYNL